MPQTKSELRKSELRKPELRHHTLPLVLGAACVLLVAATLLLWGHYGTAVFLEMLRAGVATCFG